MQGSEYFPDSREPQAVAAVDAPVAVDVEPGDVPAQFGPVAVVRLLFAACTATLQRVFPGLDAMTKERRRRARWSVIDTRTS